jgi:hypothetical protein
VFSSDIGVEFDTDYTSDILTFDVLRVPFVPDVIWASPPCTYFSVASIGKHWTPPPENAPKTEQAKLGVQIVQRTLDIIHHFEALNPRLLWYIENPCGKLRVLPVVAKLPRRVSVTYCQYGDFRRKLTDIWTNDMEWLPRPTCGHGDPCHESAPRGSKRGTQRLATVDRSRVPEELCREIMESAEAQTTQSMYCLECGQETLADDCGKPACPVCDDYTEEVPCDHPCDALMSRVGDLPVEDSAGTRWFANSPPVCSCGGTMKDYEDGMGYCCPRCGTDDGSGSYRGESASE